MYVLWTKFRWSGLGQTLPAELSPLLSAPYLYWANLSGRASVLWSTAFRTLILLSQLVKEKPRMMTMPLLASINFIDITFLYNQYSISPIGRCNQSKKHGAKVPEEKTGEFKRREKRNSIVKLWYHSWKLSLSIKSHAFNEQMKKLK